MIFPLKIRTKPLKYVLIQKRTNCAGGPGNFLHSSLILTVIESEGAANARVTVTVTKTTKTKDN